MSFMHFSEYQTSELLKQVRLIRHGESAANAGEATDSPANIPLTPLGHQQAQRVAQQFIDSPTLVVTFPFLWTYQTAIPTLAKIQSPIQRGHCHDCTVG